MKALPRASFLFMAIAFGPAPLALASIAASGAVAQEKVAAPEKNPPGDIPDNQAFIRYTSPAGFSVEVPEGWSRTDRSHGVRFFDKYNLIDMSVTQVSRAPSAASVRGEEASELAKIGRAVKVETVRDVKLKSGPAVLIVYSSNSEPNPVTNKQLRLENHRYLIYCGGTLATLDLSAPLGADNADQWNLMANSFQWR